MPGVTFLSTSSLYLAGELFARPRVDRAAEITLFTADKTVCSSIELYQELTQKFQPDQRPAKINTMLVVFALQMVSFRSDENGKR